MKARAFSLMPPAMHHIMPTLVIVFGLLAGLASHAAAQTGVAAKDTLTFAMVLEPPHLDPTAGAAAAIDEVTYANIFEGLTRIDQNGAVTPGLAERWTVSEDGLTYTFHLRPNVRFHDGKPFNSDVVRFSYERAKAPDSTNAQKGYFEPIAEILTPDPLTAIVRLSRLDGLFLFNMGLGDAVMVHPDSAATNRQMPIGTGPFRLERWVTGDRIELVRNPDHRDAGQVALSRVTIRFIPDPAAQVAALLAGDIDAMPNIGATEAVTRFRGDPAFQVVIGTTEGETILALNNARPPFNDVRVRRALQHALDREQLVDGATDGFGVPIGSHFAPHRAGYIDLTGALPYDPAKAKALLREAGFPNGFETSLRLPPPAYARRSGELIQAFLGEVGIRVRIEPMEWPQWLEQVFRNFDYDMTIVAHTEALDMHIYARDSYYFNYDNPQYKSLHAALVATVDPAKRAELYGQLQRILTEDAVNGFLFQLPKVMVHRANLVGLWPNAPIQANDVTKVRWR